MNMDYKEVLYTMMEAEFIKEKGRSVKDDNYDLFPAKWDSINNLVLKSEILLEAINKRIDIKDTTLYKSQIKNYPKKG